MVVVDDTAGPAEPTATTAPTPGTPLPTTPVRPSADLPVLRAGSLAGVALGTPEADALPRLRAELGTETGTRGELCGATRFVHWADLDVDAVFTGGTLVGWMAGARTATPLRTGSGVAPGMTVADARAADPTYRPAGHPSLPDLIALGSGDQLINGSADGPADTDRVTSLHAGYVCLAE